MADTPEDGSFLPGVPVDARGNPTVDPTKNVLDLVRAESVRQDGLREAAVKLSTIHHECTLEILKIRGEHFVEMRSAESRRVDEQASLRAEMAAMQAAFQEKIAEKEAGRIDSIRATSDLAVQTAAERASAQAAVLAAQVVQSAETLRSLVASNASAIDLRINALERTGYQAAGRQTFSDPQLIELLAEVKRLRETSQEGQGKSQGIGISWGVFLGAAGLIIAIIGAIGAALMIGR